MGKALRAGIVCACLLAAAPARAQVPAAAAPSSAPPPSSQTTQPFTGFVSPYEIAKIAQGAGFDPLAPPLREGTTYVLRATDYRGILMRVVIDARTGAIRDANRIVPGPGRYGQFMGEPPPYEPADLDAPPPPVMAPTEAEMEPPSVRPMLPPPVLHASTRSSLSAVPPLPRPRPATLASRKPLDDVNPPAGVQPVPDRTATTPATPPVPASATKPQINSEIVTAPPAAAPAAPKKAPAVVEPLND